MTQGEWLQIGIDRGWCSEAVCETHDGAPMSVWEVEQFEEGWDPCIPVVRLYDPSVTMDPNNN